ncbi:MAG: DUF1587 domain-containing protein [Acidobacteriota bacterium]|nr:DUF1587 domain-containing protein [Acidobacteriota bacterium]
MIAGSLYADGDLDRRFSETVNPFLTVYCSACHSGAAPAAGFDVRQLTAKDSPVRDDSHWPLILQKLAAHEMPPKQVKQPAEPAREQVVRWIDDMRKYEISRNAGDPGPVAARRLSNSEYDYTIRDLTGVDMRPAREFPVDPANQAGFDNSGESLMMSAELMARYLKAAREVADHMVLKPHGFDFAPYPMLVETDRDKYSVQRIVDFYDRQPSDYADYFGAAWRYKYRSALGEPAATLAVVAAETRVSPKYLSLIWQTLEQTKDDVGPLATLQTMWRALPAPKRGQSDLAREDCVRMRDFVVRIRRHTAKLFTSPVVTGVNANSQPLVSLRNRKIAAQHRDFDPLALRVEGEPPAPELVVTKGPPFGKGESEDLKLAVAQYIKERLEDPDLVVPAGQRARYEAAFARFSSVFPDKFFLRERGRFYPVTIPSDAGRYLTAGLHSVMGFFRDDAPLMELILDDQGKKELDSLWEEFEFIADYSARTYLQSVFNGGGQDRAAGTPPKEATTQGGIFATRDQMLARVAGANNPVMTQAIKDHYENLNTAIRWAERARREAEPRQLDALLEFAARAYRRPLAQDERDDILAYYRELREKNGLTHEEAIRASIVSLLVSPDFCYRVDLVDPGPVAAKVPSKTRSR